jgi:pilus assembly protein CpaC
LSEVEKDGKMMVGAWTSRLSSATAGDERRVRPVSVVSFAACVVAAGVALTAPVVMAEPNRAGTAVENVVPGGPDIDLAVGEGRLLHFDGPVDSVFLADPGIADVTVVAADIVYVYGRRSGATNLISTSADKKVRASVQFRVVANSQPANDAMRRLQPMTMTEFSIVGNRVAATGKTHKIEEAIDAQNAAETFSPPNLPPINNTTIEGSQQVNVRVRFAEVSRSALQALGFDWRLFAGAGFGTLGVLGARGGPFSAGGGQFNVDVIVEALRRDGVVNILAEPNLTAVTGQTASFLAGGEMPIATAQPGGVMQTTYKQFGVSLEFTPTIISTDRIGLHVRPEVSSVASSGNSGLPVFLVRRADTTVEVASGQTFAIAGLFQRQMTDELNKLPFLGDVPVLGALFRSDRFQRNETELVILITPYLVQPTRSREVATPLDRPAPPAVATAAPAPPDLPRRTSDSSRSPSGLIMK